MVRMSDILRKAREKRERERKKKKGEQSLEPKQPETAPPQPPPPQPVKPEEIKVPAKEEPARVEKKEEQKEKKPKSSEVRISPVVMKESKAASSEEAEKVYEETLSLTKEIMKDNIDYESIDIKRIIAQIEKLIDQLKLGNKEELLKLALIKNPVDTNRNYLFYHLVNTCIFSIKIGLALDYNDSKLIELGTSVFLHDIGMTKYLDLAGQQRKLTVNEYNEIKNHPIEGSESLERIKDIIKEAIYVAEQHHERMDGSGYPKATKREFINEYARIISLVDVFEAMTHPRIYRHEYSSLETMREILNRKKSFDYKIIKILIENIGIFPIGSLIELNTKERAQVIKINRKLPLRPMVEVITNADGRKPQETRRLDLATEPNIFITQAIKKKELKQKHLEESK